jgi:hypothetical protein
VLRPRAHAQLAPGTPRTLHERASDADEDGIVDPLPCPFDEVEALGYQRS